MTVSPYQLEVGARDYGVHVKSGIVTLESGLVTVESGLNVMVQSGLGIVGSFTANVSGQWVETHILSGEVTLPSTQVVKISGDQVVIASGAVLDKAPISGLQVVVQVPLVVKISGETVSIASGDIVQISGQGVFLPDTQVVKISGDTVVIASGITVYRELLSGLQVVAQDPLVVKVSGETVDVQVPTLVKTGGIHTDLTGASAGVVLGSGATKTVTIKAMSDNSGFIYVGGSGDSAPYSGYGFALEAGEGINLDVANFDAVYIMSTVSGYDNLTFIGVN